jgi:hypothetical protein
MKALNSSVALVILPMTFSTLYNAYVRFCNKHSLPWDKKETFGKNLKKLGYEESREDKPSKKGELRKTYWTGIRLAGNIYWIKNRKL